MNSSPSLLIAGHGYLGTELGRQARAAGWETTALTRSGDADSLACDLSDPEAVARLATTHAPTHIVHCASSGRGGPEAYRAVFLEGSRSLLAAFPGSRLLFVSSTSVYGQTDGSEVSETSETSPDRETSRLLLEAEALVLARGGTVARLAGIYGPGRSVILQRFLDGRAVIEEDGRRLLNQIHRDDAASALLHLASREDTRSEVYNVVDSTPLTQLACYQGLAARFERPLPPTGPRNLRRKRAWTHKVVSAAKLRATGWEPRYPHFLEAAAEIAPTLSLPDSGSESASASGTS